MVVDAHHGGTDVLWVGTGRSWANAAFLHHLVEATLLPEVDHVVRAVRTVYGAPAFDRCAGFLDRVCGASRLSLRFRWILLVGF